MTAALTMKFDPQWSNKENRMQYEKDISSFNIDLGKWMSKMSKKYYTTFLKIIWKTHMGSIVMFLKK